VIRNALKLAVPFVALFLIACTIAPIYEVTSAPVTPAAASAADVQKAITRAGVRLGWTMNPVSPGKMQGTLVLRTHRAVVDITYDAKSYSIKYKDSTGLNYDGSNIHRNYNGWVQNLDKGIRAELTQ
jgi:hypothetical protein